jgi:hypothetical protein
LVPLVDRVLLKGLEPCKWSLVHTEREVEHFVSLLPPAFSMERA